MGIQRHQSKKVRIRDWKLFFPFDSTTLQWCRSGREELPHIEGQGQWPRGATPRPRSGALAERINPISKGRRLHSCRRAERSYSMFKVKRGGREEVPLVPGKEQPRRDTPRPSRRVDVARGHQRADTLKP